MRYKIEWKPRAVKDLERIPKHDAHRIIAAVDGLCDNLQGDVKRLANFIPRYRVRAGEYRALFEVEESDRVAVYRVLHRRDVYRT
jgi:mRNA interferase RelE/StbE